MTIHDFDWTMFWESCNFVNKYELGMLVCFVLGGLVSIVKTSRRKTAAGKSVVVPFFLALGAALGLCQNLFYNMNVLAFGYAAIVVLALVDCNLTRVCHKRDALAARREELAKRAVSVANGEAEKKRSSSRRSESGLRSGSGRSASRHGERARGSHERSQGRSHSDKESHGKMSRHGVYYTDKDF